MLTAPAQGQARCMVLDTRKPDVTGLGELTVESLYLPPGCPLPPPLHLPRPALRVTSSWDQGLLVYANRGSEEDFKELQAQGIRLNGTIALTRYGGVGRGAKVSSGPRGRVLGGERGPAEGRRKRGEGEEAILSGGLSCTCGIPRMCCVTLDAAPNLSEPH